MEKRSAAQHLRKRLEDLVDQGVTDVVRAPRTVSKTAQLTPQPKSESRPAFSLEDIRADIGDCKRCRLCEKRTNIVFGVGDPKARLMFIGEGPGRDEDLKGEPFVGRAGQLLTKMIEAMGYQREDVYIANIVKCRPPENRYPEPDEVSTCIPFLMQQIDAVSPEAIITLGNLATQTLLNTKTGITALHGNWQDWNGRRVMPTYHPAFLLRNPNMKKPCWEDLKKVMALLKEG